MNEMHAPQPSPMMFHIGKLNHDRYWIQCPDGRMLQIDTNSIEVLERLARKETVSSISDDLRIENEDIFLLMDELKLQPESVFSIRYEQSLASSSQRSGTLEIPFFCPWIERRWFAWLVLGTVTLSLVLFSLFLKHVPMLFVRGLKEQWLIAGLLTLSVLLHETGHLCAMPRHRNISIFVQWSGPLPMLSILCNEAWKLPKWQRIRIDLAGFTADIIVCGMASGLGLLAKPWSPWVWSFLLIHLIRMIFAIWPLLPGDGYWILVDLFDQPNLWTTAMSHVKQLKMTWLSFYAAARMLFLTFFWAFYLLFVYRLLVLFFALPLEEALSVLYHPAPLFVSLTVLGQLVFLFSAFYKRLFLLKMPL